MLYVDLDELPRLFDGRLLWSVGRFNLACLLRRDHLGGGPAPLDAAVRDLVAARTGTRPGGPIRLLTHLRYFGHCFNPVSFFYCFEKGGERVDTIVAEITNTPWKETHCYVLGAEGNEGRGRWKYHVFEKDFHVSPFNPMNHTYHWRFSEPDASLRVHMENLDAEGKVFDATLGLEQRPVTGANLARVLLRYPLMTVKVVAAIYWNALRLRRKKAPFHPHPDSGPGDERRSS